jgi:hypothetical protein
VKLGLLFLKADWRIFSPSFVDFFTILYLICYLNKNNKSLDSKYMIESPLIDSSRKKRYEIIREEEELSTRK